MPDLFLPLAVCAFLAGLVRGFSGFGLSAVLVASGAFFVAPKQLIPSAQALEVVASIWMIPSIWRDVNWKWLRPLALAYAFAIPFGVAALAYAPADVLRIGGCILLLVASLCLLFNARPKLPDGFPLRFGTGLVAGFMGGRIVARRNGRLGHALRGIDSREEFASHVDRAFFRQLALFAVVGHVARDCHPSDICAIGVARDSDVDWHCNGLARISCGERGAVSQGGVGGACAVVSGGNRERGGSLRRAGNEYRL